MDQPIVGGLLAFAGGAAVALVNFAINRRVLKRKPAASAYISIVRQVLNVAYLVLAFLLARVLPWGSTPLLVGAALGLTLPAFPLALRLAKINDSLSAAGKEEAGKGEEPHE